MGREIFFCLLSKNLCSLVLVFIFVNTTSFSFGNVCCNISILVLDHYHGTLVRYVILDSSFCMNSKKLYFPYSIISLFLLLLLQKTIFCISDQTKYNPREAIFEKCYNLVCSYIFIFCYMVIVLYVILYSQITLFFVRRIFVKVIHVCITLVFMRFITLKILHLQLSMQYIQLRIISYSNIRLFCLFVVVFG